MGLENTFNRSLLSDIAAVKSAVYPNNSVRQRARQYDVDAELAADICTGARGASARLARLPIFCSIALSRRALGWQTHPAGGTRLDQFDPAVTELITLSLGFLWQLARNDLQAAQLIAGTDRAWCEQLAALGIAELTGLTLSARLHPRLIDVPGFWQDLARRRGISALQRASLGAAGLQIIMSRARHRRGIAPTLPTTKTRHVGSRLVHRPSDTPS